MSHKLKLEKCMKIEKIPTEVVGEILEGDSSGCFVLVKDDSNNTGGYIIQVAEDVNMKINGYDYWAEDQDKLHAIFQESNWKINWQK